MALQALHEFYWPGDGLVNDVPVTTQGYSFIATITAGVIGSLLLFLTPAPVALAALPPLSWWAWIWRHLPVRMRVLCAVIRLLYSPAFSRARTAVVAVNSMGIKTQKHWGAIGQRVGVIPGIGENVFRHLQAAELFDDGIVRFHHMHERNLLLELAHYGVKEFE